jgi:hypothetical protein
LFALFSEALAVLIDLLTVFLLGVADLKLSGDGLLAGGFALFGDTLAVEVVVPAVLVGEDAEEVLEQCGTGFWGGGQCEGALLDNKDAGGGDVGFATGQDIVELIDSRNGVCAGDFEGGGEIDFLAVTLQAVGGDAAAEAGPDFLLGVLVGFGAEEVVDVIELLAREGGELGERLEGRATAARGCFGILGVFINQRGGGGGWLMGIVESVDGGGSSGVGLG